MRDILVHDYLGVDLDEVWNTITHDLLILKKEIEKLFSLKQKN